MSTCFSDIAVVQHFLRWNLACDQLYAMQFVMVSPPLGAYLVGFFATLLAEAPFYLMLSRGLSWHRRIAGLLIANLVTHPAIHFLLIPYANTHQWTTLQYLLSGEFAAMAIEIFIARWIYKRGWWRTIAWIVSANLFSWALS